MSWLRQPPRGAPVVVLLVITPSLISLVPTATQQMTATAIYSNSTSVDVTSSVDWSSDSPGIVTVSSAGLVTGVGGGWTVVRARLGAAATFVNAFVVGVSLLTIVVTPSSPEIDAGDTQQMTATGHYSDASTGDLTALVTWASASPSFATVDGDGLVTGIAEGTSVVSATLGIVSGSTTATISNVAAAAVSTATQGYVDGGNTPLRVTTVPIPVPQDIAGDAVYLDFSNQSAAAPATADGAAIAGMNFALYDAVDGANGPTPTGDDLLEGTGINVSVPGSGGTLSIGPFSLADVGATGHLVAVMGNPANTHFNIAQGVTTGEYVDGTNTVDPVPGGRSGLNSATGTMRLRDFLTARPRILIYGNSLANAYALSYAMRREKSAWVRMGVEQNWAVDCRGIAGSTITGQWNSPGSRPNYKLGQLATGTIVVIEVGVNDLGFMATLSDYQTALAILIGQAISAGAAYVVVCNLVPTLAWVANDALRGTINGWLAGQEGVGGIDKVVDLASAVQNPANHSQVNPTMDVGDGTHGNEAWHVAAAAATVAKISELIP